MSIDVENLITAAVWLNAAANENRLDGFVKAKDTVLPPILPSTLNYLRTLRGVGKVTIDSDSPWFKYMALLQLEDIRYYDKVEISYTAGYHATVEVVFSVAAMTNIVTHNSYLIPPLDDVREYVNYVTLIEPILNDDSYIGGALYKTPPYIELQTGDIVHYANNQTFTDNGTVVADDGFIVSANGGIIAFNAGTYWVAPSIKNPITNTAIALSYSIVIAEAQPDPMPLILSE